MVAKRYLIVNADDFGLSPGVNRGIIKAHEHGIVTSASLMVRWSAAAEAAAYSKEHPDLSVGLHVDLCEWTYHEGTWLPVYQVVALEDSTAVANEVIRQLEVFRSLTGRNPTHIDSHQHVHRSEPLRSILIEMADRLEVPLRHFDPDISYCGNFYGQTGTGTPLPEAISTDALIKTLSALQPGITELACHPGFAHDLDSVYCNERAQEVNVLCDPAVRAAIVSLGIRLCSFHSVAVGSGRLFSERIDEQ